ncbi:MAG: hypothetical protein ACD_76C00017G0003, partial [uncultured bacterium]
MFEEIDNSAQGQGSAQPPKTVDDMFASLDSAGAGAPATKISS